MPRASPEINSRIRANWGLDFGEDDFRMGDVILCEWSAAFSTRSNCCPGAALSEMNRRRGRSDFCV
jgi:hypothetical protein